MGHDDDDDEYKLASSIVQLSLIGALLLYLCFQIVAFDFTKFSSKTVGLSLTFLQFRIRLFLLNIYGLYIYSMIWVSINIFIVGLYSIRVEIIKALG